MQRGAVDSLSAPVLDAQQLSAVFHPPDKPLLVTGGAGSGKSEVIARRAAHLLLDGAAVEEILVLASSVRGAARLRSRIFALCNREVRCTTFRSEIFGAARHLLIDDHEETIPADRRRISETSGVPFVSANEHQSIFGWRGADGFSVSEFRAQCASEVALAGRYRAPKGFHVVAAQDTRDETAYIVSEIASLIRAGVRPSRIGIIGRFHSLLDRFPSALGDAGVPARRSRRGRVPEAVALAELVAVEIRKPWGHRQVTEYLMGFLGQRVDAHRIRGFVHSEIPFRRGILGRAARWIELFGAEPAGPICEPATLDELLLTIEEYNHAAIGVIEDEAVNLMTIHGCKGLEFGVVFLVGMEDGIIPDREKPSIEEKRLFDFAVSRAASRVFLTHTRDRNGRRASPSSFLKTLQGADVIKL